MNYKFSDYFKISKDVMDEKGIYDISIVSDTPVFIDPFLLYVSNKPEYQNAHEQIMKYLLFLCKKIKTNENDRSLKQKYFYFKEPKQNWFGFSKYGNSGRGLNKDFADKFYINLKKHLSYIENENFSHFEELIIFEEGFGKDSISDFTTKLILPFLLDLTEKFAQNYIDETLCNRFLIEKAYFDFEKEEWCDKEYYLPSYNNDFIILTPTDIIVENDDFLSRNDLLRFITYSSVRIPDSRLRDHVNDYLSKMLDDRLSKEEKKNLTDELLDEHPEIISFYTSEREKESDEAIQENKKFISKLELILDENVQSIISFFENETEFYNMVNITKESVFARLEILDSCLQRFGDQLFYVKGKFVGKKFASVLVNRLWNGSSSTKSNVDFRFTFNSPVEKILSSFDYSKGTLCYISLSKSDIERFDKAYNKLNLSNKPIKHISLIKEEISEK